MSVSPLELALRLVSVEADGSSEAELLGDLKTLRRELEARGRKAQVDRVDAALLILEFLDREEEWDLGSLQVVALLVASVEEESGEGDGSRREVGADARSHSASSTPAADVLARGDLRLVSDILLGEILYEQKILTRDQLGDALREQLRTALPLGKCILALGLTTEKELQRAIGLQDQLRAEKAAASSAGGRRARRTTLDPEQTVRQSRFIESLNACLLGQILIRLGSITPEQLERAVEVQRATGIRIGEALVQTGATSRDRIHAALRVQGELRCGI